MLSTFARLSQPFNSCGALQETAAIIIEPILGEGGFLTPPPGFLSALRALCDKHGMLLIFDEVGGGQTWSDSLQLSVLCMLWDTMSGVVGALMCALCRKHASLASTANSASS